MLINSLVYFTFIFEHDLFKYILTCLSTNWISFQFSYSNSIFEFHFKSLIQILYLNFVSISLFKFYIWISFQFYLNFLYSNFILYSIRILYIQISFHFRYSNPIFESLYNFYIQILYLNSIWISIFKLYFNSIEFHIFKLPLNFYIQILLLLYMNSIFHLPLFKSSLFKSHLNFYIQIPFEFSLFTF